MESPWKPGIRHLIMDPLGNGQERESHILISTIEPALGVGKNLIRGVDTAATS
jgi:hypothetical protein